MRARPGYFLGVQCTNRRIRLAGAQRPQCLLRNNSVQRGALFKHSIHCQLRMPENANEMSVCSRPRIAQEDSKECSNTPPDSDPCPLQRSCSKLHQSRCRSRGSPKFADVLRTTTFNQSATDKCPTRDQTSRAKPHVPSTTTTCNLRNNASSSCRDICAFASSSECVTRLAGVELPSPKYSVPCRHSISLVMLGLTRFNCLAPNKTARDERPLSITAKPQDNAPRSSICTSL